MNSQTLIVILVVAATALLVGFSKGGLGSAVGSFSTPLMALVMSDPKLAVGAALIMLLVGDLFAVQVHWNKWDRQLIAQTMPSTIVGVVIGAVLLGTLDGGTIQHGIGILVLLFVAYKVAEPRLRVALRRERAEGVTPHAWYGHVFGSTTAIASTIANAGGPLYNMYLLMQTLTPRSFAATATLYFALLNLLKVPFFLYTRTLNLDMVPQVAWAIPLIFLGVQSGKWLDKRIDMPTFERVILVLLFITAVFLLVKPV